jgi:anti-sigma factor ChrR (cupin superfamily)
MLGKRTVDDRCFADLAPFYVLDGLSAEERQWVEAQVAAMPELAEELAELESTIAALSYAAPPVPMATDLQSRLFERIGVDRLPAMAAPEIQGPESMAAAGLMAVRSPDLQWRPYRVPKVMMALLHIDQKTRYVSALFRAEAGMRYPAHRHGDVEEIYMLAGDLWFGDEHFGPGDYIRTEKGSKHLAAHSNEGCMFFVRASLDDEYDDLETALPVEG